MEITLDRLGINKMAVITTIATDAATQKRLRDYGLVPGTIVRCRYRDPGGTVSALEFRGSVVAIRTKELKRIRGCGL